MNAVIQCTPPQGNQVKKQTNYDVMGCTGKKLTLARADFLNGMLLTQYI